MSLYDVQSRYIDQQRGQLMAQQQGLGASRGLLMLNALDSSTNEYTTKQKMKREGKEWL